MPRGQYNHDHRPVRYNEPLERENLLSALEIKIECLRFCDRRAMLLVVRQANHIVHCQSLQYRTFPQCKNAHERKERAFEIALNWVNKHQVSLAANVRADYRMMNSIGCVLPAAS